MDTVYIETTIVSLLVARPSRDPIMAAHQQVTRRWWRDRRLRFNCVTSEEVLREAAQGDSEMSRLRLDALAGMPVLPVADAALRLAEIVLQMGILPPQAFSDAIHVATASHHGVPVLLTWNCRHLANPFVLRQLRAFMSASGLTLPEVCTPVEFEAE
jgi:predicted nucleic acid-binding protein